MRRMPAGKVTRPMAICLLGWLLAGIFLPLTARADALDSCLKDTTVNVNGEQQTMAYASAYPEVCAAVCYAGLSPEKKVTELTLACAKCYQIADLVNTSIFPNPKMAISSAAKTYVATFCAKYIAEGALQAAKEAACDKGPHGCCISNFKAGTDGKGKIDVEECYKKPPIYYGDCFCIVDKAVVPPNENNRGRSTYNACQAECDTKGGRVDVTQGIGRFKSETEGSQQLESDINILCWKPDDCGYAKGIFTGVDPVCPTGQGYCLAPEPTIKLSSPVLGKAEVTGIRGYIELILRVSILLAMIGSAIMFVYGGFRYIMGASMGDIATAKSTISNALVGLVLTFSCILLLNTLNPATSRYDKLGLKMINSVKFTTFNWCPDYKSTNPATPLKFGYSGDPPGQLLYSESKLETKAEDTLCGKEYYIEGYTGQRCSGQKCEEKGKMCFPCKKDSGVKECGDKTFGNACVKANFAGYITYADGRIPKKIELMAVCNWIQPGTGQNFGFDSRAQKNLPAFLKTNIVGATSGDAGGIGYMWAGGEADIQKLQVACKDQGGLRGVVIGMIYKDTQRAPGIVKGAIAGGAVGGVSGAALGPVGIILGGGGGAVVGGVTGSVTVDDVAILTKKDCGNGGASRFLGYADGTASSYDETDMQTAFYCGSWIEPGGGVHTNLTSLPLTGSMWTPEELKAAVSSDAGIRCDFTLTDKNAPSDPGTNLMSKCDKGWCPEGFQPKCNENN